MRILTFDIEEWYHLLELDSTSRPDQWVGFEPRLEANTERILMLLSESGIKATFFVMGWIARHSPSVIRRIAEAGHELGVHSWDHALISKQSRMEFREDLKRSCGEVSGLSGTPVRMYRAPGFSIVPETVWALEELMRQGIVADASIFPTSRAHGGFPSFPVDQPCIIKAGGMQLYEFPLNTAKFFNHRVVFSGGGYFRLLPYEIIRKLTNNGSYVMSYFHPRDFDPGQKMLPGLTPLRMFKSYYGLHGSLGKLARLISEFDFVDIGKAIEQNDWSKAYVYRI